jgi:hypothetical protein
LLLDNSREKLRIGGPANATAVTWQEFRENFRAYHIPEGMIELKAEEFMNLTQGSLSVAEYCDRFAQLSRYAPHGWLMTMISNVAS